VTLWIPGPLPGMNELIAAAKGFGGTGRGYSNMKRDWTDRVALYAKAEKLRTLLPPVMLRFRWVEKARRRDPDNIAAGGRKLVLDGLVKAGVIGGDGWTQIAGWIDTFEVDRDNPGVEVSLARPVR